MSLRLVTYNIHKGIGGVDRLYRPERVIEVLRRCRADLICLQEVDEGARRSRGDRQVDLIGDALDLPYRAYYPNHRLREGHYGNAILSRFPLDHDENVDLTVPLKKRRSAVHARLTVPLGGSDRRLWLFNVHLGLAGFERKVQLRRLLVWLKERRVHTTETGIILAGDFNDVWGAAARAVLLPAEYRTMPHVANTFPAWQPVRPLDRCFVHGPISLVHAHRSRTAVAKEASDHLPLVCILEA